MKRDPAAAAKSHVKHDWKQNISSGLFERWTCDPGAEAEIHMEVTITTVTPIISRDH